MVREYEVQKVLNKKTIFGTVSVRVKNRFENYIVLECSFISIFLFPIGLFSGSMERIFQIAQYLGAVRESGKLSRKC